jgi:polyphenol oxidase
MLQVKRRDQITFLQSEALQRIPGITHAFSTRRYAGAGAGELDRVQFLAAIGATGWPILKLKQVHSGTVVDMRNTAAANDAVEGDASVTGLSGVILGVQTADCVPILIADLTGRAVAAVHAGWRGTAARISEAVIAELCERYSVKPKDLVASIGPHIGACCYEVGLDVLAAIPDQSAFEYKTPGSKPYLDLAKANRNQLLNAGLVEQHIETSSLCTKCREDLFHSYRRDGKRTGHMLSVIGIGA